MINRQKYNLAILNKIEGFLKEHPDFRFIQVLWALDIIDRDENNLIIDRFYEEPNITLDKVKKSLEEFPMREKREKGKTIKPYQNNIEIFIKKKILKCSY